MPAIKFPLTDAMRDRLADRQDNLKIARAILRSSPPWRDVETRWACKVLMMDGDHWDWADATKVLLALDKEEPVKKPGIIRRSFIHTATFAALCGFCIAVLVVFLAL